MKSVIFFKDLKRFLCKTLGEFRRLHGEIKEIFDLLKKNRISTILKTLKFV